MIRDRNTLIGEAKIRFPLFSYRRIPRNKELPPELEITVGPWAAGVIVVFLTLIAAALGLELPAPSSLLPWFR
jgi:hypothetical protein